MTPATALNGARREDRVDPQVVKTGLILTVGALAVVFDTTIVSVALRLLATDLDVSVATIQWVTTGYLLALGMAIPLSTWALERFGGRQLWMFALVVFLAGSVGSSLAWNAGSLIGWRVVQGIGGGLLMPAMGTLIMQAAAGRALGRTASAAMLPLTVGPILGPLVGGVILTHLSWRFMFWVNVQFCVAGLVLAWAYLPGEQAVQARGRSAAGWLTDKLGVRPTAVGSTALVTVATVPFMFITAHTSGWLFALWLVLRGLGLGAVGVPATAGAYQELGRAEIGHSTVLTRTAVQVGGCLGTAVLAIILDRATATHGGDIDTAFGWSVGFGIAATALAFWLPGRSRPPAPADVREREAETDARNA
jgi:MFS family permease